MNHLMTIGHSTLEIGAFLKALHDNDCTMLVDVRSHPGSRKFPQFGKAAIRQSIEESGIQFAWCEQLGGWKRSSKVSINGAWRNASFRNYADYMQEPAFEQGIDWLLGLEGNVAIMCAESVPWRCHRSLIADAAVARGIPVENIFVQPNGASHRKLHELRDFARVDGNRVWYPAAS